MTGDVRMRRLAVVVFALLVAAAIGTIAYHAGVSHGVALQPPVAAAPPGPGGAVQAPPYPYYPYGYYRPWRFGFFGPLLFVFFWVFLLRGIFFWGGWGWRRRWHSEREFWPDRFDEWHRRAHDRMKGDTPAPQV